MAADADPRLVRLAESVSDRAPVTWSDVRATDVELRTVIDGLERVETLAEAFAAIQVGVDPGAPTGVAARWGQLEILEPLGEGAFAEVFRARDPNLEREVALKLRPAGPGPDDSAGRRLLEEARRLARINHPNVVTVHGADLCDGRVGIWTELVEGRTLEQRLAEDGPLGPGEAVAVGIDLCRALAAIHAAGLVHGDVKAANVIRERGGRIVLADLGSATEAGARPLTGSPATLAPEVLDGGRATAAADLYSLGLLIARLLTGARPRAAATLRDLRPDLPELLVAAVERAVEPDPERRFPSAGALERALANSARGLADAPSGAGTGAGSSRRRFAVAAVAAAAVGVVAVGLWVARTLPEVDPQRGSEAIPASELPPRVEAASPMASVPATAAPAADPLPGGAADTVLAPLTAQVTLLRAVDADLEPLADGDRVGRGDRLALEIRAGEPIHVWVVNEDLHGDVYLLFPIDGLDQGNPLAADRLHRLPGRFGGVPQHWQVTSTGGRERFLVVASRRPLPDLDRELASLTTAGPRTAGRTRGVGGLSAVPAAARTTLDEIAASAADRGRQDGSVWLRWMELANP